MKKIMVIGNTGSGKTTLARLLSQKLDIPVYHLDAYFHGPNWTKPKPDTWPTTHLDIVHKDTWIIDGNYRSVMSERANTADLIIFLQQTKLKSLFRIIKRKITYLNTHRPELPEYLKDKITLFLLYKLFTFSNEKYNQILEKYKNKVIVLKNNKEIKLFLESI